MVASTKTIELPPPIVCLRSNRNHCQYLEDIYNLPGGLPQALLFSFFSLWLIFSLSLSLTLTTTTATTTTAFCLAGASPAPRHHVCPRRPRCQCRCRCRPRCCPRCRPTSCPLPSLPLGYGPLGWNRRCSRLSGRTL